MKTIWLIEDDKVQQFIIKKILLQARLAEQLSVFNNGLEALTELFKDIHNPAILPNAILLDINMPVMDGWGFLDNISMQPGRVKSIPVLMFTSSINSSDMEHARQYPSVKGYLIKPCTGEELLAAITKVAA